MWIMTFLSVLEDSVLWSLMTSSFLYLSEGPSKSSRANPRAWADAFAPACSVVEGNLSTHSSESLTPRRPAFWFFSA